MPSTGNRSPKSALCHSSCQALRGNCEQDGNLPHITGGSGTETDKSKPANEGLHRKKEKVFLTHFLEGVAKEGFTEERDPKLRSEGIS